MIIIILLFSHCKKSFWSSLILFLIIVKHTEICQSHLFLSLIIFHITISCLAFCLAFPTLIHFFPSSWAYRYLHFQLRIAMWLTAVCQRKISRREVCNFHLTCLKDAHLSLLILFLLTVEDCTLSKFQFSSVQSLSRVRLFATPWTAAC